MRLEETTVMPAARKALNRQDWKAIDAAFLDNDDPLFGERVREAHFDALKAQHRRARARAGGPGGLGPPQFHRRSSWLR